MRRITYTDVLKAASVLWTGKATPDVDEAAKLNTYINRRAREAWESAWWRELMVVERRWFRSGWDTLAVYGAPSETGSIEVYYPPTDWYYQSLRSANVAQAPADAAGTVNSAWWAECAEAYSGDDWEDATVYAVGDAVRNASDGRYYACHTAHTSSGSIDTSKFGILTPFVRSLEWDADAAASVGTPPVAVAVGQIVSGTVTLLSGVDGGTVTGLALTTTPSRVFLSVRSTAAGVVLSAYLVDGTLSADGFTFVLSGLTEEAGYKLDYLIWP